MKYFIIFVLFVVGCSEEYEIKRICSPFRMTISDAIPVQFWVNGVETYNQKEVCGITQACFCQPFECDDEIRIQFQEATSGAYKLIIYSPGLIEITRLSFSEVSGGVYQLSFVPSELDICNEQVVLKIATSDLINGDFNTGALSPWTNVVGGIAVWSVVSNKASVTTVNSTRFLIQSYQFIQGQEYTLRFTTTTTGDQCSMDVTIIDGGSNEQWVNTGGDSLNPTINPIINQTYSYTFTPTFNANQLKFRAQNNVGPARTITLDDISIDGIELAVSDCLDIKESHDCSALIRYDNSKDFADIEYSDFSPNAEFYLRIPAVFFHERNTEEQERFETSGETIVRLRDEIKVKRLLEVGFMPDYMHRKLLLILAHDTIEIDSETWVRTDPYEKLDPANKRYPLKRAQVLLTQQGYIKRNIL